MHTVYVEQREDGYWVADTRVSLDSIVYAFLAGQTAESIAQSFPVLSLEQVYGAVAFYLANRAEIDAYLANIRDTQASRPRRRPHLLPKARRRPAPRAGCPSMKVRFQADADLNQIILRALTNRSFSFAVTQEFPNPGALLT